MAGTGASAAIRRAPHPDRTEPHHVHSQRGRIQREGGVNHVGVGLVQIRRVGGGEQQALGRAVPAMPRRAR